MVVRALRRGGAGPDVLLGRSVWVGGQRRPDGNVGQRLLEGEQVWLHLISQRTGFLPWDSLLPRPSSQSLLCLLPPKKSQVLGRGEGEWGPSDLHPLHPCPLRGGRTLDRGDGEAVPVPLPGSSTSEPQADPRAGGRVHGGHR